MANLDDLSLAELQDLIKEAQFKLEQKQNSMRKEVITQIKELAASVGVTVDIIDNKKSNLRSAGVAAKYANPNNPTQVWSGRGLAPKWMQALIDEGQSKEDFLIREEDRSNG
jgi:DNA-binding protein H-NS